jgi:hypothetical protein
MKREFLAAELSYEWKPFTLDGAHLTFQQHVTSRLERYRCSCWGAAVYKWEGLINKGPHGGKTGVLIGETGDLRQRIKQYVTGTQGSGNRLWREKFLMLGDIRLFTLDFEGLFVGDASEKALIRAPAALLSNNMRLVLEQLLISREVAGKDSSKWIVNARQ